MTDAPLIASAAAPRPIGALSISHTLRSSLADAGYKTTADILGTSSSDLAAELGIKFDIAQDLLRQCADPPGSSTPSSPSRLPFNTQSGSHTQVQSATAASLLSTSALPRFSLCIEALDDLLGIFGPTSSNGASSQNCKGKERAGGITTGQTVELAGPPGIGKTTIALGMVMEARLQVCDTARRREERERARRQRRERSKSRDRGQSLSRGRHGAEEGESGSESGHEKQHREGLQGGEALIIDTEGAIPPDKLYKLAEAVTRDAGGITPNDILAGIHLVRIATQVQMVAFLNLLDEWLAKRSSVNLVIIDSLSYHFRQPSLDLSARRRIMDMVKQQIGKATMVHQCAVVATTQMATKLLSAEGKRVNFDTGEKAVLMPQLGESWQTAKTIRIALFRGQPGDELRYAHVDSASDAEGRGWARFDIDMDGLPIDVSPVI